MTVSEIIFLSVGVLLGGIYASIGGSFWLSWLVAGLTGLAIGVAVTFWRRRFA